MSEPKAPRASRPDMPGYGIVGENEGQGLLPWSWAGERLASARQYFLSTVRPDGRPHVLGPSGAAGGAERSGTVVLWGVWLDDRFWFSTARDSRKARNLSQNRHAVVTPEGAEEAVIVEGEAAEVEDAALLARFGEVYQRKYGVDPLAMKSPVFALRPRVVFGQPEKKFTEAATRWQFDA